MQIQTFTGGLFDTNCFFLPSHGVLIDAPQDCAGWLESNSFKVKTLLLTHGHIDHVWDAARIKREHGCQVGYHPDNLPMLTEPGFFRKLGFGWDIDPIAADFSIGETASRNLGGIDFQVLLIPGHCPGSLCFYSKADKIIFGGDVLFAGGVGRWDLPGGDRDLLFSGIQSKLMTLPDDIRILPGHGPATTIGVERKSNPYLQL